MGTIEFIIWNILGYGAIPLIFLGGFAATAFVACFFLEKIGYTDED